ncbi:PEP-CTERM sorting domain-containing protein [Massilia sp. CCM 8734]|uniref:PEP-CTERM sorting domain-containing protein n=1 Tax=Massilia sp. CCM 8734 TaxID=2609283 RepID=UPI0014242D1F|nr:PEP-CTERM sorting domain-containing protein [Massilia sp. CCM 8734]NHZ96017.1 PEP-CTERM sorting domain-containing protein [Massilia sp. CCM 8734]
MKHIHALLALSLIPLAVFPLANAQVSARASVSHIGISLIDLAPDDGIAPSYSYTQAYSDYQQATTRISYGPQRGQPSASMSDSGLMPWTNHHLDFDSTALPEHQGAHLAGTTRRTGTSLETLDLSVASSARGTGSNWVESTLSSYVHGMALSPHTALRLTFDVDVQSTVDPKQSVWDNGWASSFVLIEFVASLGTGDFVDSHLIRHTIDGPNVWGGAGPRTVAVDFTNTRDTVIWTHLKLWGNANSAAPAAPIPEPSRYAMLAVGLGLIGLLRLRRI